MNPRIYKKQAKRAVELLRSHGGWHGGREQQVFKSDRWDHPEGGVDGIGIDGCPVFGGWGYTQDGREWDEWCPRSSWIECHYWSECVPADWFNDDIDKPWPSMTVQQRRERFNHSQIAPGWAWRGGRAVKIDVCAAAGKGGWK